MITIDPNFMVIMLAIILAVMILGILRIVRGSTRHTTYQQGKSISETFEISHNDTSESTLIEPGKPFSNESAILNTIKECHGHIYWFDKYFGRKGLEWITEALQDENVKLVKILAMKNKDDPKKTEQLRNAFKKFRVEMEHRGVTSELRILVDRKTISGIHDRWIITSGTTYNIPSTDVISRGQISGIVKGVKRPNFEEWWDNALDIFDNWGKIQES